jgi:putative GTP pyrophosphokinase
MEPIHDILAFRVVCPFLEDTTRAEEKLRSNYIIHDVERKGENHTIGEFGYNSTHLELEIPERIRQLIPLLDIEIVRSSDRTILQDAWAEVEHELI